MLRIHRGLSVLIIVALLVTLLGEALPLKAASSLRGAILSEAAESKDGDGGLHVAAAGLVIEMGYQVTAKRKMCC